MQEKNTPENAGKSNGQEQAYPGDLKDRDSTGAMVVRYQFPGFTKLEVIAKDILAEVYGNTDIDLTNNTRQTFHQRAEAAIAQADALLAELAKPQG